MNRNFFRLGVLSISRVLGAGALKIPDGTSYDSPTSQDKTSKYGKYGNLNLLNNGNKHAYLDVVRNNISRLNFLDYAKGKAFHIAVTVTRANSVDVYKDGPRANLTLSDVFNYSNAKNDQYSSSYFMPNLPQKNNSTLSLNIAAYVGKNENEDVGTELVKFGPKPKWPLEFKKEPQYQFGFEFPRSLTLEPQIPELMNFKASQILLNPNKDACRFSAVRHNVYETNPRPPESVVSNTCEGPLIRFAELNKESLFPKIAEKQVILARGEGEFKLDFTNEHVNRQIDNLYICNEHRNELSTKWDLKKYPHVVTRRKIGKGKGINNFLPVCSLPFPFGANHRNKDARPFTCRHKVTFEEASAFLEANGILIHPGIPVCNECSQYLKTLLLIDDNDVDLKPEVLDDFDDVNMDNNAEETTVNDFDMYKERPSKLKAIAALQSNIEDDPSQTTKAEDSSSEVAELIRRLGQLTGISIPTASKPFEDLKNDTQQRKVKILQGFQQVIAQHLAPDDPSSLIELCNSNKKGSNESTEEKRMKNLMTMIKTQYLAAESKREQIGVISQIALEVPRKEFKKVLPGITKYQWNVARRQAREHMEQWKVPAVMAGLPFGTKVGRLPDGRKFDIPSTLRKQDDAEIIRMFEHYVKEKGLSVTISHTVMRNILKVCPAVRMKAMECVDYFEAAGKTAFEKITNRLDKLYTLNLVDEEWKKEVQQELQEAKLYLRTDYRLHIAEKSQVAEHCMTYSLSDPQNKEFCSSSCDDDADFPHSHNGKCDRCLVFPQTMKKIHEMINELLEAEEKTKGDHEKLKEINEEMEIYENDIFEWKKHVMRSAYSEKCRLKIIDELEEGQALVTCDYSQKWIPRKYRETQKEYFAKKGLSWHITHILAKKDGQLVQHTVVHNLGFEDQAYTFSEPQAGKGPSDREGARIKWRMLCALNNMFSITTSEEMFLAMTYGQKRLDGITALTATVSGEKKEEGTPIPGITSLSHIQYDKNNKSFTVWKHHGIGKGKKMNVGKAALKNELIIYSTTSETPLSDDYIFWRNTGSVVEKQKKKKQSAGTNTNVNDKDEDEEKEEEKEKEKEENSDEEATYKMFHCTDPNCIKKYVHYANLCNHIESGKHTHKPLRKTLYDYALTKFGDHLDDLRDRHLQLFARETFQDYVTTNNSATVKGWALRSNAKNKRFSNDVHKYVEELLLECKNKKKRFDPKVAAEAMENAKRADGRSRFKPSERLNDSQLSGLAQRKLKKLDLQHNVQVDEQALQNDRVLINEDIEADTGDFELEYEDDPTRLTTEDALYQYVSTAGSDIEIETPVRAESIDGISSSSGQKKKVGRQKSVHKTTNDYSEETPMKKQKHL
uniref:C2H2-type domain-containing protein n=1 Tax=Panagrolaimus sp. ES5 TaxID=591445 RepID=A0AC34GUE5_9BILA